MNSTNSTCSENYVKFADDGDGLKDAVPYCNNSRVDQIISNATKCYLEYGVQKNDTNNFTLQVTNGTWLFLPFYNALVLRSLTYVWQWYCYSDCSWSTKTVWDVSDKINRVASGFRIPRQKWNGRSRYRMRVPNEHVCRIPNNCKNRWHQGEFLSIFVLAFSTKANKNLSLQLRISF